MPTISVHLGYVLGHLDWPERMREARRLGFRHVEVPFPFAVPAEDYRSWLDAHGLSQISIGVPTPDYRTGAPGHPFGLDGSEAMASALDIALRYATAIRCPAIHVFSGVKPPTMAHDNAVNRMIDALNAATDRFAPAGVVPLLEFVNSQDFPRYFVDTPALCTALIRAAHGRVGMIFDYYHCRRMEIDPVLAVEEALDLVRHIQLASFPGRNEPVLNADLVRFLDCLRRNGYAGSIGFEFVPSQPVTARSFSAVTRALAAW